MIFRAARSVFSRSHTGDWLSVRPSASERMLGETASVAATATVADEEHRDEDPPGLASQQHGADDAEETADPYAPRKGEEQRRPPKHDGEVTGPPGPLRAPGGEGDRRCRPCHTKCKSRPRCSRGTAPSPGPTGCRGSGWRCSWGRRTSRREGPPRRRSPPRYSPMATRPISKSVALFLRSRRSTAPA